MTAKELLEKAQAEKLEIFSKEDCEKIALVMDVYIRDSVIGENEELNPYVNAITGALMTVRASEELTKKVTKLIGPYNFLF